MLHTSYVFVEVLFWSGCLVRQAQTAGAASDMGSQISYHTAIVLENESSGFLGCGARTAHAVMLLPGTSLSRAARMLRIICQLAEADS